MNINVYLCISLPAGADQASTGVDADAFLSFQSNKDEQSVDCAGLIIYFIAKDFLF